MNCRVVIFFLLAAVAAGLVLADNVSAQGKALLRAHFRQLMKPPTDSAEAERVRIWVPQERTARCRVTVDILDNSNKIIRHLVNQLLYQDYYNFYWDKKDDSGRYVDSGSYRYVTNDCGGSRTGEVEAQFKKWELLSRITPFDTARAGRVDIELLADSALVSIDINFTSQREVDAPVRDSLMQKGHHRFEWEPDPLTRPGRYLMTVTVGDFQKTFQFRYRKEKK